MKPRWRHGAGMVLILAWITLWCVLAVSAVPLIAGAPRWLHFVYFLVAGIVWTLPLKPLLRWMELGRFRALPDSRAASRSDREGGASDGT